MRVEGREVLLRPPKDNEPLLPQVMLFSNGDVTPFELTLAREGSRLAATVASQDTGEHAGEVVLTLPDEAAQR